MVLLLGTIGIDVISGHFRFSFDIPELGDGIGIVPVAVGLFGLGEILSTPSRDVKNDVTAPKFRELLPTREELRQSAFPIARGSILGFFIGIIPGSAHIISSFVSMRWSGGFPKHPEEFGKGAVAGVAGPESANNAASTGAFVPMLALGIPTGPVIAVLMAALLIHGIHAGPAASSTSSRNCSGASSRSMYVGNLMLLALNLPLVSLFVSILRIPYALSLSDDHHVLRHRRVRGEQLGRRCLDDADLRCGRLSVEEIRLRSGAAGARPCHRADLRIEFTAIADHVWRLIRHFLSTADRAGAMPIISAILLGLAAWSAIAARRDWRAKLAAAESGSKTPSSVIPVQAGTTMQEPSHFISIMMTRRRVTDILADMRLRVRPHHVASANSRISALPSGNASFPLERADRIKHEGRMIMLVRLFARLVDVFQDTHAVVLEPDLVLFTARF